MTIQSIVGKAARGHVNVKTKTKTVVEGYDSVFIKASSKMWL